MYIKKSEIEISKGELFIQNRDLFYVNGNEYVTIECHTVGESITTLDSVQYNLLKAIPAAMVRFSVFMTIGWMEWGAGVKKGNKVYIRMMKDGEGCCFTAVVRYIGAVTGTQPGTLFGVEITMS